MKRYFIFIFFVIVKLLFSQSIIINEICSSNSSVIQDKDGYFSDWIEIINTSESTINLSNFSISDDEEIGIYVEGNGTIPNYQQDWEKPIHIDFFEPDGVKAFGRDAEVQIHGGSTREYPQKSLSLEAIPKPGNIFTCWSVSISSNERIISYKPSSTNNIIAKFQVYNNFYPIVINEINYNPPDSDDPKRTDWIELYNNSNYSIDQSVWKFKVETKTFNFPIGTILNGKNFLVIANSFNVFQTYYPVVINVFNEDSQLGLDGGGEEISLYSLNGILIDTLEYDDKSPLPKSPDGNGPTLELKHPDFDNTIGKNWSASTTNYGTPGEENNSLQNISSLDLKIFLEGSYIFANIMNNSASQISSFPLLQPFGSDPWNYLGNEKIEQLPNSSITDWVLVELREEINSNLNVVRRAALLNINGQITDLDGIFLWA